MLAGSLRRASILIALAIFAAAIAAEGGRAADYFAGKSIDLLIGAPPARGYDNYARARALARHYLSLRSTGQSALADCAVRLEEPAPDLIRG
jgi:hypothetical protein